jgi:16S rRNA (guanine966-N2)-methyltransferase
VEGARVLDLFAGTGALGIEALSRGAVRADFVEADARLGRQLREALAELSLDGRTKVYPMRVEKAWRSLSGPYDLVFADPPYNMDAWESLMGHLGTGSLMRDGGIAVIEYRHGASVMEEYGGLVETARRRYGDTAISIFRAGAISDKGDLPRQL